MSSALIRGDQGFSLTVVLAASAIILAGCVGLAMAATQAKQGAAKQVQSALAQQVAEAGAAITLDKLNSAHRYLLVESLGNWSNVNLKPVTVCPGAATTAAAMPMQGNISGANGSALGNYTIKSYTFSGSRYYGGTGTLVIQGQTINPAKTGTASAEITEQIDVRPKNCGGQLGTPPTTSGFPGLLANSVSLGNADVLGNVNGNILCLSCLGKSEAALATEINKLANSVVNGNIFGGSIPLPPIPEPPAGLTSTGAVVSETRTFNAGNDNGGACVVNHQATPAVTYCRLQSVNLSGGGKKLIFNTAAGPIRVYVDGDFKLSGNAVLEHTGSPEKLVFYGLADDGDNNIDQTMTLNGGSTAINAFVYMPDASVGINGGPNSPDLRGAIWSREFGISTGSSSNNADLEVPDGMGALLTGELGDSFNISIRDFTGAGIRYWSTHANH